MKPESEKFLKDIKSDSEETELAAWTGAGKMDPEVIPPLSELLVSDNMKIAKAADEALKQLTHSVGEKLSGKRWRAVVSAYVEVIEGKYADWPKGIALRHLSLTADKKSVPAIAKCLDSEAIREEAVFCLERIPGKEATEALAKGLKSADAEFKPRILVALGHRGDKAGLDAVMSEYRTGDAKTRLAALEALAKIGVDPKGWKWPEESDIGPSLTPTQQREFTNNLLLLSDAMVAKGHGGEWLDYYKRCLKESSEEHVRCAGIAGLVKAAKKNAKDKAAALAAIEGKLDDESYIVQITAKKAIEDLKA